MTSRVSALALVIALVAGQREARADYPGCDRIGDYVTVTHCMANCCATHDQWYAALGCTEESWIEMVGLLAQALPPLAAAGEALSETMSAADVLAACTRHPDACGPALIQMLTTPICSLANLSAADCIADCESGRSPEPPVNMCVDGGQTWMSSDPNCCDDQVVGGSGPNPAYCAMPSCPFSCDGRSQQPYPNCGCYCANQCGDYQTRDDNDCGCHCNFTCEPPYTQGADCQCIAPTDPCLGVVCDRGADDHCEAGQCVCNPTNSCDKVCANGAHGARYADDGCGNPLSCNCGCNPGCDICDPISGACPDLGCGPGSPGPDSCGQCGGDGSECACNWFDCQGTCNGGVWNDACGVCGGDGSSCACNWRDCQGTCNGGVWNDACGVCGGDGSSCACNYYDCAGTCNGGAAIDACGVCGGDGSSCACNYYDCAGTCNGGAVVDSCGVCGGDGSSCACSWYDCQGTCNGGVWNDACGVCGGNGSSCACSWYDCQGTCNGGVWNDACGVCGGDGSSCACNYYDCAGTCNGGAQYDWCGVCNGDGSECGGGGGGGGGDDGDDEEDF